MTAFPAKEGQPRPHQAQRSRLVVLRQYFQISQGQFGAWLGGYSQANVSQWETGLRPMPYAEIAETFGVSVDWLMGLSPVMWGFAVINLRRAAQQYLITRSPEEQRYLASPVVDPADRIRYIVSFCRQAAPKLITDRYLMGMLHLDQETFSALMQGNTYADRNWYARLAEFLDLPVTWFEFGNAAQVGDPCFEAYRSVISTAVAKGISAERLAQLLALVAPDPSP